MAQTSTSILSDKDHIEDKSGTVISFSKIGTDYKISSSSTSTVSFGSYSQYDLITVTGASNSTNNSTFTVKSVSDNNDFILVEEEVADENAGSTITLNHTGFVSAKFKGDGYYSQPDGVHTVSYKVSSTVNTEATIKMQATLATTPTEDDWADISNTTPTLDQSTTIFSYNFTGNYVWVRAKITGMTAGTITEILLNH